MNTAELRQKTNAELNEMLLSLMKEQFQLRMKKNMTENPKTHVFGQIRKNIARIKTILNETNN